MAKTGTLYETDFALWADGQAEAIEQGRWADVDVVNVAEEMRGLSGSRRSELKSRLVVLLAHLLKERYQPEKATKSWTNTIEEQADAIQERVLSESPSLRREVDERMRKAYRFAVRQAVRETGLVPAIFPAELPDDLAHRVRELLNE